MIGTSRTWEKSRTREKMVWNVVLSQEWVTPIYKQQIWGDSFIPSRLVEMPITGVGFRLCTYTHKHKHTQDNHLFLYLYASWLVCVLYWTRSTKAKCKIQWKLGKKETWKIRRQATFYPSNSHFLVASLFFQVFCFLNID